LRVDFLYQHCQTVLDSHGGLILTLFLGGLMGGFTHCAGMCGPFVLAQLSGGPAAGSNVFARLRGAALTPYHLGRMTTYMILGIVAASVSGMVSSVAVQHAIAVVMLVLAGGIFLFSAFPAQKTKLLPRPLDRAATHIGNRIGLVARPFFEKPTAAGRYGLGFILGFLPCGMLAAALMAVAATADPLAAAAAMAAFCAGTVPALFLVGSGGQLARARWPRQMASVARGVMVFNSISLFVIAGGMII
jgi:sulfite exporter TauE/SafE